jgi:protein tyrosine phosphatase (PTP) superfamily phosphohydrolase (DUF442 family)
MLFRRLFPLALLPLIAAAALAELNALAARAAGPTPAEAFPTLAEPSLHNAHRVTDKVLSGAAPEGDDAFKALKALGVKTIISVDGAKPDVETARKFGLRYVHLPIGYDDVAPDEGRAIARAIDELPGPIYVHCHHGKHRSAAAVAVACVLNGRLKPGQAESVLRTFGTGENYKGLWASALGARPLDRRVLEAVTVDYRETAPVPPLAEAMVEIDQTLERLKLSEKSGWRPLDGHPDVDPPHEALQLMEKLHELGRTHDVQSRPGAFRQLLADGEAGAQALHDSLTAWSRTGISGNPPAQVAAAMKTVNSSCTACHKSFRD